MTARPRERALQAGWIAKLVARLRGRAADDRGVELERIGELKIAGSSSADPRSTGALSLAALARSRIVLGEDLQGLAVL